MDVAGEGVGVYAEAKGEYTKQLCQYMLPALQQYFLDMFEDAKRQEPITTKVLLKFQQLLEEIADWNIDKVQRETSTVSSATNCDYLEELLTAVFIAHTKVLSAIRLTTRQKKLQITIPKLDHFLHRTMTECSRLLWSNIYLFSTSAPSIERQKNLRLIEGIMNDAILHAIRGMLPVKNILREYLREDEDEVEEAEEEAEEETEKEAEKESRSGSLLETEIEAESVADTKVEAKAEVKAEAKAEVKAAPITVIDVSGQSITAEPAFTGIDTKFNTEVNTTPEEEVAEEEIKILDNPPEAMDDFEDLENATEILKMDFEELP